ncbi:MAG: hypothetical protein SO107_11690, partial [Flavonifractor plautii]|nr:hypothetical protein [Flavonifractor plautii]
GYIIPQTRSIRKCPPSRVSPLNSHFFLSILGGCPLFLCVHFHGYSLQIPIENARGFIRRMKNMYDSGACDDIIFIGLDDNQVEQSFNLSTIIKSININVAKDENQHYDSDEVKNSLLHEIR